MSGAPMLPDPLEAYGHALAKAIPDFERRRRRRRRMLVVTLPLALIVAVAVFAVVPGGEPSPALAITSNAQSFTLRVVDVMADDTQMNRELAAAGVPAKVQAEPAEAGSIGQWVAFGTLGRATPEESMSLVRDLADQVREHPTYVTIDKHLGATLLLIVGRPPRVGESPCAGSGVAISLDDSPCRPPPRP